MSNHISAAHAGQFMVGGDIPVNRLGFGAMRITGPGIWGEPEDPQGVRDTLLRLPEIGVNLIDTADSYGPFVSENLIREVLHPYTNMLIATKGALTRPAADAFWEPVGRPAYLRQCVRMSLRRLNVDRIDLWQLHRIDPKTPREEQFEVVAEMRKEGLIRHVGLSEVSVEDIEAAQKYFPVATVQNEYNLVNRKSEAVLNYCEQQGIGFIPWFPLAAGDLARPGSVLSDIAERLGLTTSQVALAWILKRSPVMLPIPGTSRVKHLEQNVAAAAVPLAKADFDALEKVAQAST
ncbi:aryl-alcohol dehydrogenase-like predicted oxidoreductase [Paraburkholderia sp. CI2]|uniref:aldo/keto reductase n=1 Tax=Paraburkholderia sp. CI2 TaxID=2723093 RepID=UPI0016156CC0|nr:aldo/keto reductase [Paraburkholderia sp. CI2]MBB5466758.1 aryl-alcohol dehydrogenase-like predicted oxidoreductase [Paraburkholderia sp. CI2]